MADSIVFENQPAYGTWLIPIIIFGALALIGVFVFLKFFLTYGCSCGRDQGVGEVEERGASRAVLRKGFRGQMVQHTGVGLGILHPHMMLFPSSKHDIPARPVYQHDQYIYPQSSHSEESIYQESYRRVSYPQQAIYFQQLYTPPLHPPVYQTPPPVYEQSQGYQTPQVYETYKYERQSYVQSFPKLHPSDSNESLRLAYDDFPSTPSVSSQSSGSVYRGDQSFHSGLSSSTPTLYSQGSYYPLDSILSRLRNNVSQSFSSDSPSLEVPKLKFTPPSVKDLASLALGSVCSVEDLLQAPDVDRFGRAVPQSRSAPEMPSPSKLKSRNRKSRCNRAIAIIGNNVVVEGTNEEHLESSLRNILGDVQQNTNTEMKKRRRTGGVYNRPSKKVSCVEDQNSRRKSFMVKVSVPFTNDLWKFWVARNETLGGFTRRVRDKCGFEIGLFIGEEMLVTEEDWKLVSGGIKITAQPL